MSLFNGTRNLSFDSGWLFFRGDTNGAETSGFDDSEWRSLDLPHDWSVEDLPPRPLEEDGLGSIRGENVLPTRIGPFDTELSQGKAGTGWFVGGTGWYRKHFTTPAQAGADQVEIVFDGVYMAADCWLNGVHLGNHPHGYTAFGFDLTPYLRSEGDNILAVRVRNEGQNTRWYSGFGIYRRVWLNVTGQLRVPLWGVKVTTPEVNRNSATVQVAVNIESRTGIEQEVTTRIRLLEPGGREVGLEQLTVFLAAGEKLEVGHEFSLEVPQLWSVDQPHLYNAEIELLVGESPTDRVIATFGIRSIEIDSRRGLRINGEMVKLRGGCLHHDHGILGAAAFDRAEERRVELMKTNGFNAIRTSHNPPSSAFMDACDRLGIFVIEEAFDMWQVGKNPEDYHRFFPEWWERDLAAMVLRDFNRPSVIFWSIGNEIPGFANPAGLELAQQLVTHVKKLDPSRPVTAAIERTTTRLPLDPAFEPLDVAGYNYMWWKYEGDHETYPERVMLSTESYPLAMFENWQMMQKHPYVIGDFVWTGMDYLGESSIGNAGLTDTVPPFLPNYDDPPAAIKKPDQDTGPEQEQEEELNSYDMEIPINANLSELMKSMLPRGGTFNFYGFPWFNAFCGDIDLIGEVKPQLRYKQVLWGMSKLEMAVQQPVPAGKMEAPSLWGWSDELSSWTWPGYEGKRVKVRIYSSAEQVRLLLNGKEIGLKPVSEATRFRAEFTVPYTPGELRAVALVNGQQVATKALTTAGPPAALRLLPDREAISPDRHDLGYLTLEVVDGSGNSVPDAAVMVNLKVTGAGELVASGTANPKDVFSFRKPHLRTFHGKCLAIVRPTGKAGTITVQAAGDGLNPTIISIKVG